ncbi:MAG: hypothetical protein HYY52_01675 [Candidatus Melainabacteria bacterium]|nr:hypothetical protein [Candidatus Melainabacteria bacterium]
MNYSIQKLVNDFIKRIGPDDLKMLETVQSDMALNYMYFLYKKIYGAYPTGEVYEVLASMFTRLKAA